VHMSCAYECMSVMSNGEGGIPPPHTHTPNTHSQSEPLGVSCSISVHMSLCLLWLLTIVPVGNLSHGLLARDIITPSTYVCRYIHFCPRECEAVVYLSIWVCAYYDCLQFCQLTNCLMHYISWDISPSTYVCRNLYICLSVCLCGSRLGKTSIFRQGKPVAKGYYPNWYIYCTSGWVCVCLCLSVSVSVWHSLNRQTSELQLFQLFSFNLLQTFPPCGQ
jgi:hypothetical protein